MARARFLLATLILCQHVTTAAAGLTVSGFLAGSQPQNFSTLGSFVNRTTVPFLGYTETAADLNSVGWTLSIRTSSFISSPSIAVGLQEASARIAVNRIGQMAGPAPFPSTLTINGTLTGQVTIGTNSFHDGSLQFGDISIPALDSLFFPDSGSYSVNIPLTATVPVNATGSYPIDYSFTSESYGRVGQTTGDFSNTLKLASILLPNGMTPESAGYTLTFDDGTASPNAAVPEPSAFAFLSLVGIGVGVVTWWNKRRVA